MELFYVKQQHGGCMKAVCSFHFSSCN